MSLSIRPVTLPQPRGLALSLPPNTPTPVQPLLPLGLSFPIGDLLIIMAQIIISIQMVLEEKFVYKHNVHPLRAVGTEGMYEPEYWDEGWLGTPEAITESECARRSTEPGAGSCWAGLSLLFPLLPLFPMHVLTPAMHMSRSSGKMRNVKEKQAQEELRGAEQQERTRQCSLA